MRWWLVAVALVLAFSDAGAETWTCVKPNGKKVKNLTECRLQSTPAPTPSPAPSPKPGDLCPDGTLSAPASKTDPWFGLTVEVPNGATKRFCAPVQPPLAPLPAGQDFYNQITFSWYDVSDQDCGALNVRVDATDGVARTRSGEGFSASGNYYYYGKIGSRILTPEQTKPGIYVVTVTGGPAACTKYRITWKAS